MTGNEPQTLTELIIEIYPLVIGTLLALYSIFKLWGQSRKAELAKDKELVDDVRRYKNYYDELKKELTEFKEVTRQREESTVLLHSTQLDAIKTEYTAKLQASAEFHQKLHQENTNKITELTARLELMQKELTLLHQKREEEHTQWAKEREELRKQIADAKDQYNELKSLLLEKLETSGSEHLKELIERLEVGENND